MHSIAVNVCALVAHYNALSIRFQILFYSIFFSAVSSFIIVNHFALFWIVFISFEIVKFQQQQKKVNRLSYEK